MMRRVLISGSREIENPTLIINLINSLSSDSVIIEGEAYGADRIARVVAEGIGLTVEKYPITSEDWNKYGKAAGPIRNKKMLEEGNPNEVHAFFAENFPCRGTSNMVTQAMKRRLRIQKYYADEFLGDFNLDWYQEYGITDPKEIYGKKFTNYKILRSV